MTKTLQVATRDRQLNLEHADCKNCPLGESMCPVFGGGAASTELVIVGEAPGYMEKKIQEPFVGQAGKLLDALLREVGLHRDNVYVTHALLCEPPQADKKSKARVPPDAIRACRPRLVQEIKQRKPRVIVTVGGSAAISVHNTKDKFSELVGEFKWSHEFQAYVISTYHPSSVLRGSTKWFEHILMTFKRAALFLKGEMPPPNPNWQPEYIYAVTPDQCAKALEELISLPRTAFDLETSGFRFTDDVLIAAFSDGVRSWVLEGETITKDPLCRDLMVKHLTSPNCLKLIHNIAFDGAFTLEKWGCVPEPFVDTMCLALGTTEQAENIGLKLLSQQYLNASTWKGEVLKYAPTKKHSFSLVPRDILAKYAAKDVVHTYNLEPILRRMCIQDGTLAHVEKFLMPAQRAFIDLERRGIQVDFDYVDSLREQWPPKIADLVVDMQEGALQVGFLANAVAKKPKSLLLSPGSPKQLAHLFFDILKLQPLKARSTDKDWLKARKGVHPMVDKLAYYRTMTKMYQTYIEGIAEQAWPDGAVRPRFLLGGTVTGRLAAKSPPIQTIPKEKILEKKGFSSIKRQFIARPGYTFVEGDYSQLEIRIAWHYSKDMSLGDSLAQDDFHVASAMKSYKVTRDQVDEILRDRSKFVTFGVMYGRQAPSIAQETGITVAEAQSYIDAYFFAYPLYGRWWKGVRKEALDKTELQTTVGRKRRWPLITKDNVNEVLNQAVNFPIQSLASDLCLNSLILLNDRFKETQLGYILGTVHDSILAEIRTDALEEGIKTMKEIMIVPPFETCAKFEIDFKAGPSWGQAKKYKFNAA